MRELVAQAERVAALLLARKETVAVAESSAGGLITAALTEGNALVRARFIRSRMGASWGIGETGAAGPALRRRRLAAIPGYVTLAALCPCGSKAA